MQYQKFKKGIEHFLTKKFDNKIGEKEKNVSLSVQIISLVHLEKMVLYSLKVLRVQQIC